MRRLNGYGWRLGLKDETEAAWLTYMYQQLLNVGARVLAADLNSKGVKTRSGLDWTDARLRNPMYKGEYQYGRKHHGHGQIKAVCQVEPLISPELWAAAQDATQRRKHTPGRRGSRTDVYPLQGRLTCTHRKLYPASAIHVFARDILEKARENPAALAELVQRPAPTAPDLATTHAAIDRKLSRLEAAYDAGAYTAPEYAERRAALKREREALSVLEVLAAPAPADLAAVRAAVGYALTSTDLLDVAQALNLRGVLGSGGELTLRINPL